MKLVLVENGGMKEPLSIYGQKFLVMLQLLPSLL